MEPLFLYRFFMIVIPVVTGIGLTVWMVALLRRPLRERHEAEVILDLIDRAEREGRAVERDFVELAQQNDRALGSQFQILASWMGQGLPLAEALRRTPEALPEPIRLMLIHGLENNLLAQVLPACRLRLEEADSRWRTTMTVITGSGFGAALFSLPLMLYACLHVLPRIKEIAIDMWSDEIEAAQPIVAALDHDWALWCFSALYLLMLVNAGVFSGLSPARGMFPFSGLVRKALAGIRNRIPWIRLRLERDLSALMAAFLDAGLPAEQALVQAGEAVGDPALRRQALAAAARVREGRPLEEALACIRDDRQFRWHLRNAAHSRSGFAHALAVWHDALSARALFREQATSQITTAVLVMLTGALIATVSSSIFRFLSLSINQMTTW